MSKLLYNGGVSKLIVAIYVFTTSLGLIFLKLGTTDRLPVRIIDSKPHFSMNFYTAAGIFLYGASFLLYTYLISKNDLGFIIPLTTAFVYIVIFVASYFIFKESFTALKIAGITLIVMGLVLLNLKK